MTGRALTTKAEAITAEGLWEWVLPTQFMYFDAIFEKAMARGPLMKI